MVREWFESVKGINKVIAIAERNYKKAVAYGDTEKTEIYKLDYETARTNRKAAENLVECVIGVQLRMTLRLYYIDGLKWSEIAYITDSTVPTVKSRLDKAIEAIEPIWHEIAAKYNIETAER